MDVTKPVRKAARKTASLARRGTRVVAETVAGRGKRKKAARSGTSARSASRSRSMKTRSVSTRSGATRKRSTAKKSASRRSSR